MSRNLGSSFTSQAILVSYPFIIFELNIYHIALRTNLGIVVKTP